MTILTELPNELLLQICEDIAESSPDCGQPILAELSCVSERLRSVSQRVLYHAPWIGPRNHQNSQIFLFRLVRTLLRNKDLRSQVVRLQLCFSDPRPYGSSHRHLLPEARVELAHLPQDTSAWQRALTAGRVTAWVGLLVLILPKLPYLHFDYDDDMPYRYNRGCTREKFGLTKKLFPGIIHGATGDFASFSMLQSLKELHVYGFPVDPIWFRLPHLRTLALDATLQMSNIPQSIKSFDITTLTIHHEACLLFSWTAAKRREYSLCTRFIRFLDKCKRLTALRMFYDGYSSLGGTTWHPEVASYDVLIRRIAPVVPTLERLSIGVDDGHWNAWESLKIASPIRSLRELKNLTYVSASTEALLNPPDLSTGRSLAITALPEGLQHLRIHRPSQEVLDLFYSNLHEQPDRYSHVSTLTLRYEKDGPLDPPTLYLSQERAGIMKLGISVAIEWDEYHDDPQWFKELRQLEKIRFEEDKLFAD
jgi:hypothetical protein